MKTIFGFFFAWGGNASWALCAVILPYTEEVLCGGVKRKGPVSEVVDAHF